ncbi:MAG: Flp pilus assembly protein CpaB [Pseudomonadota bacterium]
MKTRFKLNKTWIILGIALVIGAMAALAARTYLSTQVQAIEARGKSKTVNVVVASRELKRGDKITSDTVAVRAIPIDYAHSAAISPDTFDRVDGQALAYPVRAGEMILWGLMETKRSPTFSAKVESGHRAMTVAVDEINSISGMLEPGDLIDLLVTVDSRGKKITRPLLQSVQVMATGQQASDSPRDGERRQYSTVTIDTTPAEAQNVIMARDAGRITALLRNPEDKSRIAGANVNMAELLGSATHQSATPEEGIPVLYGGNATMTPEALSMARSRPAKAVVSEFETALSSAMRGAPSSIQALPPGGAGRISQNSSVAR